MILMLFSLNYTQFVNVPLVFKLKPKRWVHLLTPQHVGFDMRYGLVYTIPDHNAC